MKDIIDRWLDPHYRYFKVMGSEGGMYMLRHDVKSWKWEAAILSHGEFNQ